MASLRSQFLLNMMLITLAAFVAGGAFAMLADPLADRTDIIAPARDTSLLRVATRFYEAMNAVLASGDDTGLLAQFDPDFVSYAPAADDTRFAASLVSDLHSLRDTFPNARIEVRNLDTRNDLVFATIQFVNGNQGKFLGIELDRLSTEPLEEVLRIRNGVLTTRWGAVWSPTSFQNVASDMISIPGDTVVVPELRQWRVEPNGYGIVSADAWQFLFVESGSLGWEVSSGSLDTTYMSMADGLWQSDRAGHRLDPGDAVVLPVGASARFWNSETAPARLLVVEVSMRGERTASSGGKSSSVTRALLARGLTIDSDAHAISVSIGQITLPSSSCWHHKGILDGGEMLLVTGGSLNATTDNGLFWIVDENSAVSARHEALIDAGRGMAIEGDASITYHATGPNSMIAWIVTFMPADMTL
jgi:hypothetical protein